MEIKKYNERYWSVYDGSGKLICVTVYKKGAQEVVRLLENKPSYCLYTGLDTGEKATKV